MTENRDLLEALPGPAWIVDCLNLQVLHRNDLAGAISQGNEFLLLFDNLLDDRLTARLRSGERPISFHARLKGDSDICLFSASLVPGQLPAARLVLAQPTSQFDVPGELTFDEFLDSGFDGLLILNADRRIVQISRRFHEMFGYTLEDLRGKTPLALIPPGSEHEFAQSAESLDRGGVHQLETRRLRRDGTLLEVQLSSQPIAAGRFRGGLVVIYRDITEARRDARYRNLRLESSRILAQALSLQEAASRLLPAIADTLGWEAARLWLVKAGRLECFHHYAAPECDRTGFETPSPECARSLEVALEGISQRRDTFQTEVVCAQHTPCPVRNGSQVVIPIMDSQKQVLGVLELLTPRRNQSQSGRRELLDGICSYLGQFIIRLGAELALAENEAKFRTLAETIPAAIFIHRDGIVLYANAACEALSGYPRDEILGSPLWVMFHADDVEEFRKRAARRLNAEEPQKRYEIRLIRKDGNLRWVDYSAARITLDHQPAVLCAAFDITEQRALEAQLRQTQKMEAIGRLAGGIAHDFNNLLMVIQTYADLLQQRLPLHDGLRRNTEQIMKAAERGASLTSQMLAFSRKQIVSRVPLDLNVLIEQAAKMLRRLIGEDVEFQIVKAKSLGVVEADQDQIFQVLMNLCVNARDAMPQGGTLTIATGNVVVSQSDVGTHPDLIPGDYVRFSVTDTGIGISRQMQQQIFEPFFTTKEVGKGTGLGLATVYGIVQQSGGHVTVVSEPGRGARFDIYLPRVEQTVASEAARKAEALERGTETILVVEDEEMLRKGISEFLGGLGYTVLTASSGEAALMLAAEHESINLLLSDVVMPKMSGRELSQVLGAMRPYMKIILMSGYTNDEVLRYGIEGIHSAFLQKPFSLPTLARKLRETLDPTQPL